MLFGVVACSNTSIVACDPVDPRCQRPVAAVHVTSAVDSVMAVGTSAQLEAQATDASGNPVPAATFTWTSTNPSTASVDATGFVQAQATGATQILATTDGAIGALQIRIVDADLGAVDALLHDAFLDAVVGDLDVTTAAEVAGLLTACSAEVMAGRLLAADLCLDQLLDTTGRGGTDAALLAIVDLVAAHARSQLQLDSS